MLQPYQITVKDAYGKPMLSSTISGEDFQSAVSTLSRDLQTLAAPQLFNQEEVDYILEAVIGYRRITSGPWAHRPIAIIDICKKLIPLSSRFAPGVTFISVIRSIKEAIHAGV